MYYERHGSGIPVVCLHGFGGTHRNFKDFLEPIFAKVPGYERHYFDLPGMGQSPVDPSVRGSDEMLDVVLRFIDEKVAGRPFLLGGFSYGGYLARAIVKQRPEQVLGVLLMCPLIHPDKRDVPPKTPLAVDEELLARLTPEEAEGLRNLGVMQTEDVWAKAKTMIFDKKTPESEAFLASEFRTKYYALSFDVDDLAEPFMKPSVIFTGRQDHITGYRDAYPLLDLYPRAALAVLDEAGHMAPAEKEPVVNALVEDWLERVKRSRNA